MHYCTNSEHTVFHTVTTLPKTREIQTIHEAFFIILIFEIEQWKYLKVLT